MSKFNSRELLSCGICVFALFVLPLIVVMCLPEAKVIPRLFCLSEGIWQPMPFSLENQTFTELRGPVQIAFDSYGIPHIVAENDTDLYFAQGVLEASFRLFEMDLSTRAGMGRLSELVGPKALEYDRFFTTFGMRNAVKSEAKEMMRDPQTAAVINAFLAGVNAYIHRLTYRDLPLEYKLLAEWPEEWGPERLAALLKIMTFRLAGRSNDLLLTKVLQRLGEQKTMELFPEFMPGPYEQYFVDSSNQKRHNFDWSLPFVTQFQNFPEFLQPVQVNGSNVWAVAPEKSKTGFSVLANDTHLSLQLPSVWFENQLISPTTNVYGASFPGTPGVVLGLNGPVAWGVTNGTTDVLDWYQVEFRDKNSIEYKFDGEWKKAEKTLEEIVIRGGSPQEVSVLRTEYGFIMDRQDNFGLAARWEGHEDSNELKVILALDHADRAQSCVAALKDWHAPVQNFTCADENNISIYHAGRIPIRESGQGRVVENGVGTKSLWKGEIPFAELPHENNPSRHFVFSANERPVGSNYSYYLGWDYEEPFRGQRIRTELMEKAKMDGNDFVQMQNDIFDQHAALALPVMLRHLRTDGFGDVESTVYEAIKQWDYYDRAKGFEPTVFQEWWKNIMAMLWAKVKADDKALNPSRARTLWFFSQIEAGESKYAEWLEPYKSLDELITRAFHKAVSRLTIKDGSDPTDWLWTKTNITELPHVAKIPGLGSPHLLMDGGAYSIMANKGHHGPAWKLVVELGPHLRAWSQFPGGVTGNPFDPDYQKFVEPWSRGEMRMVQFWKDAHEAMTGSQYVWKWTPP